MQLKQSTARTILLKLFLSSDHVSPATGKTLTVTLSKNGAAFAGAAGTPAELSNGWYKVDLTTADTNTLGDLAIRATAADSDAAERLVEVVAFDPQSATGLGLSNLTVATSSLLTTAGYTAPPSAASIATAVWAAGTRTLTSFGTLAADVWASATRTLSAFAFSVTASSVTDKTGYSLTSDYDDAKTAAQPGDAMTLTSAYDPAKTAAPTAIENADALLTRDWTSVSGEAARSTLNALRALRNKVSRSGGTLTITQEDDTTEAWTAALTTDVDAEPITEVDPA